MKIKEAADQHHPAYDEKAWQKMEKLLDQHLPQQKDDRRRILFALLLLIFLGGGVYLVISKPWNNRPASHQFDQEDKNKVQSPVNKNSNKNNLTISNSETDKLNQKKNKNIFTGPELKKTIAGVNNDKLPVKNNLQNKITTNKLHSEKDEPNNNVSLSNYNKQDKNVSVTENGNQNDQKIGSKETTDQIPSNSVTVEKSENKIIKDNTVVANNQAKTNNEEQTPKPDTKKTGQREKTKSLNNNNGFSFFISVGPDVSKAGSSKTGQATLVYGVGVGYTKSRFTLKTGIYAAKKIYWAGSNDYRLSFVPPPTTKFEGANANCDVVEIPVKLSYDFNARNKGNWFVGTGLSSYLMKKEKYIYTYKSASATTYYPYQTKNENKHYFSVLNLSAGYKRQVSNSVSISA
ncbi:MAG: hypothetical protein ACHQF0_12240, partial [Chitinophagales bacterium]